MKQDIKTELEALEKAVAWAEIQLENCSFATGDSNRAKVREAKKDLAEFKAVQNGR